MKWYRSFTLATITGAVCGTLYNKCKTDSELRKTLLQFGGVSIVYTSVGFLTTALIPRLNFACYYVTLNALVTSSNFLFTRQFLLEREWLFKKSETSQINLYKVSAVSGAETGFLLEGILTEGGFLSTLKATGFWTVMGVALQLGWFLLEDWRIRKSLSWHRPDLYQPSEIRPLEVFFSRMEKLILGEWEIDRAREESKKISLFIQREVDKNRQAKQRLKDIGIHLDDETDIDT